MPNMAQLSENKMQCADLLQSMVSFTYKLHTAHAKARQLYEILWSTLPTQTVLRYIGSEASHTDLKIRTSMQQDGTVHIDRCAQRFLYLC